MKDLGPAKQILGMKVSDRESRNLWLSQEKYIEKILDKFNMKNAKPVETPFAGHFKLSFTQGALNEKEKKEMVTTQNP